MKILALITISQCLYVGYLQIKNLRQYRDGNGKDKERKLFMLQIFSMLVGSTSALCGYLPIVDLVFFILAFNSVAFYKGWDITLILRAEFYTSLITKIKNIW